MPTYPIPDWEPDRIRSDPSVSATITNVIPVRDGYRPFNGLQPFSDALPGACRGSFLAIDDNDIVHMFAGTADALFKLSNSTWADVTRLSGGAYNLADGHAWSFTQHTKNVIAANVNDAIQKFELSVDTEFSQLSGSPDRCKYVTTESGYLTLGHLSSAERTIRRSGYKDPTFWTVGLRGSDQQVFSDGGRVAGFASDATGTWVFQDRRIRRLQNRPGEEVSFGLSDVDPTRGTVAPRSIVHFDAGSVEFLSEQGFFRLSSPSVSIGADRIDRTFLDDIDLSRIHEVQGVADPINKMNWWRYSTQNNAGNAYSNRLIGHTWPPLDKWVYIIIDLEELCIGALPGYTLEEMETTLGYANLEDIPYTLDSRVWKGGRPTLAGFDTDHKLGFFQGDYLEAILDSADIPIAGEGKRASVSGFRPIGDITGVYGSAYTKETFWGAGTIQGSEQQQNATGLIPVRASGRTIKLKTRIPHDAWGSLNPMVSGFEIPPECIREAGRR